MRNAVSRKEDAEVDTGTSKRALRREKIMVAAYVNVSDETKDKSELEH